MGRRRATDRLPPQFHVGAKYVHADSSRLALRESAAYIDRRRESDDRDRCRIKNTSDYVLRQHQHVRAQAEVVGARFFCRGTWTADQVWDWVDRSARTKSGRYHARAGGRPRLAILAEFSLPHFLPEQTKVDLAHELARKMVTEYGCAVQVACHIKPDHPENGIDHCHLLVSMREIDETGAGKMIRRFNGIASSMSDERVVVPGRGALSGHIVAMRSIWAEMLTEATGVQYDWRSYADQGLDLKPAKPLSRQTVEGDRREGGKLMADRAAFIARRNVAYVRRLENRARAGVAQPKPENLVGKIIAFDPRLSHLSTFSPMALLAAKVAAEQNRKDSSVDRNPTDQRPLGERATAQNSQPSRDHLATKPVAIDPLLQASSVFTAPALPAVKRSIPPDVISKPRHAISMDMPASIQTVAGQLPVRLTVARRPAAVPSDNSSDLSMIEREMRALNEAQREASMAEHFAEKDARVHAARHFKPRPNPPSFTILDQGDAVGTVRPGRMSEAMPRDGSIGPSTNHVSHYAIAFGAALIISGWRTAEGESQLAAAAGVERNAFSTACQTTARELKQRGMSSLNARMQARAGAPGHLQNLFDSLETERLQAKQRLREQKSMRTQDHVTRDPESIRPTRLQESSPDQSAARTTPTTARPSGDDASAREDAREKTPLSQQKPADTVKEHRQADPQSKRAAIPTGDPPRSGTPLPQLPRLSMESERKHPLENGSDRTAPIVRTSSPEPTPNAQRTDLLLQLAALLSLRGRLQSYIDDIVRLTGMTIAMVHDEIAVRLQAIAQMNIPRKELWTALIARARRSGDTQLNRILDRIVNSESVPPRTRRESNHVVSPRSGKSSPER